MRAEPLRSGDALRVDQDRRSEFAFRVAAARSAEMNYRAARGRVPLMLLALVALMVGEARWWSYMGWLLLTAGALVTLGTSRAELTGRAPRDPLTRWAYGGLGVTHARHAANPAGLAESVGCLVLIFAAAWGMSPEASGARLALLGVLVAVLIRMYGTQIFGDLAFYNPQERAVRSLEALRRVIGPVLAGAAAVVVLPAPWPGDTRVAAALACAGLLLAQAQVHGTDALMAAAVGQSAVSRLDGRVRAVDDAHAVLSLPLKEAVRRARPFVRQDPELYDGLRAALSQFREFTSLASDPDVTLDWPGVLVRPVQGLCRRFGVDPDIDIDVLVGVLQPQDWHLTRLAVDDLVSNALASGCTRLRVRVAADDGVLVVLVDDDAPPFPPGAWLAPGGGLSRLQQRLQARGGELTLHPHGDGKTVRAAWLAGDGTGQA